MPEFQLRHSSMFCSFLALLISLVFWAFIVLMVVKLAGKLPAEYNSWLMTLPGAFVVLALLDGVSCSYSVFVDPRYIWELQQNFREFLDSFHTDTRYLTNAGRRRRR